MNLLAALKKFWYVPTIDAMQTEMLNYVWVRGCWHIFYLRQDIADGTYWINLRESRK